MAFVGLIIISIFKLPHAVSLQIAALAYSTLSAMAAGDTSQTTPAQIYIYTYQPPKALHWVGKGGDLIK